VAVCVHGVRVRRLGVRRRRRRSPLGNSRTVLASLVGVGAEWQDYILDICSVVCFCFPSAKGRFGLQPDGEMGGPEMADEVRNVDVSSLRGYCVIGVYAGCGTDKRGRSQMHLVTDNAQWPERLNLNFAFNPLTGEVILPADLVLGVDVVCVEVTQEAVNFGGGFVASSVLAVHKVGKVQVGSVGPSAVPS